MVLLRFRSLVAVGGCLTLCSAQFPASLPELCTVPTTLPVRPWSTCADFGHGSSVEDAKVDLAAQRGETEAAQLLLRYSSDMDTSGGLSGVAIVVTGLPSSVAIVNIYQVGFVDTRHSPRYEGSGGGWRPDPLLPAPADGGFGIAADESQPIWLEVVVDPNAKPGTYNASIKVTCDGYDCQQMRELPLTLSVWDLILPTLEESSIGAAWSGTWNQATFEPYYTEGYWANWTNKRKWYDLLLASRTPPDSLYVGPSTMRPVEDYVYLASKGMRRFGLLDVTTVPFDSSDTSAGRMRVHTGAGLSGDCGLPDYTDAHVTKVVELLKPLVTALDHDGLLNRAYVYGFDELPAGCEPQVRKLFGGIKAAFPTLTTMAVLNWSPMPVDLPLDIWVLQYLEFNATNAAAWTAAGKEQWHYHCIEPHSLQYLNTFIERRAIQPRLLFWLAALWHAEHGAPSGWLYYAVNLWRPCQSGRCGGFHRPSVMKRSTSSSHVRNSAYTDFPPANYIWEGDGGTYDIFANGDGFFMYPCEDGPCSTIRLSAMRDGLEDWEIFSKLDKKVSIPLLRRLVRGPDDWTEDPELLERTRREAAFELQKPRLGGRLILSHAVASPH